jgi:hypothetical protein
MKIPFEVKDFVAAVGLGCLAYGFSQIYYPAAFIVPGAIMLILAVFSARVKK